MAIPHGVHPSAGAEVGRGWQPKYIPFRCAYLPSHPFAMLIFTALAPAMTYESYISPASHPTYSKVPNDIEAPPRNTQPSLPGKIIPRPMSMRYLRDSIYRGQNLHDVAMAAPGSCGLTPPPRPPLPRTRTPEPSRGSRFRLPFRTVHNLSLSAFGSQPSMQSQFQNSSLGECSADDGGALVTTSDSHEKLQYEGPRSDTPMSMTTFGRATASRH